MKRSIFLGFLTMISLVPTARVATQTDAGRGPITTAAAAPMSEGEVRKVDKGASKVTIKHGPLQNLDMPAMTMVFRVRDPAMPCSPRRRSMVH